MTKRISQHYTVSSDTDQSLREMQEKFGKPMSRIIDEAVDLYRSIMLSRKTLVCRAKNGHIVLVEYQVNQQ